MFYTLISRIPQIYKITNKREKLFRIFVIGTICYLITHGCLYSKSSSNNLIISKYRKYLVGLCVMDFVLSYALIQYIDKQEYISTIQNTKSSNSFTENVSDDDLCQNGICPIIPVSKQSSLGENLNASNNNIDNISQNVVTNKQNTNSANKVVNTSNTNNEPIKSETSKNNNDDEEEDDDDEDEDNDVDLEEPEDEPTEVDLMEYTSMN
jgi:hypothetical protein